MSLILPVLTLAGAERGKWSTVKRAMETEVWVRWVLIIVGLSLALAFIHTLTLSLSLSLSRSLALSLSQ